MITKPINYKSSIQLLTVFSILFAATPLSASLSSIGLPASNEFMSCKNLGDTPPREITHICMSLYYDEANCDMSSLFPMNKEPKKRNLDEQKYPSDNESSNQIEEYIIVISSKGKIIRSDTSKYPQLLKKQPFRIACTPNNSQPIALEKEIIDESKEKVPYNVDREEEKEECIVDPLVTPHPYQGSPYQKVVEWQKSPIRVRVVNPLASFLNSLLDTNQRLVNSYNRFITRKTYIYHIGTLEEQLVKKMNVYGLKSPLTFWTILKLAEGYRKENYNKEAKILFQNARTISAKYCEGNPVFAHKKKTKVLVSDIAALKKELVQNVSEHGLNNLISVWTMIKLAEVYRKIGLDKPARRLLQDIGIIIKNYYAENVHDNAFNSPLNVRIMMTLVTEYSKEKWYKAAEKMLQSARIIKKKSYKNRLNLTTNKSLVSDITALEKQIETMHENEANDSQTLCKMVDLITLYREAGWYPVANSLFTRALIISKKLYVCSPNFFPQKALEDDMLTIEKQLSSHIAEYGENHPDNFRLMVPLASCYRRRGWYLAAEKILTYALTIRRKLYEENAMTTAIIRMNLVGVHCNLGKYKEAIEDFYTAFPIIEKHFKKGHPKMVQANGILGDLLLKLGKYEEAKRLSKKVLKRSEKESASERKAENLARIQPMLNLASAYHHLGQPEKAKNIVEKILPISKKHLGDSDYTTATIKINLGVVLISLKKYKEARGYLEQALTTIEEYYGSKHPQAEIVKLCLNKCIYTMHRGQSTTHERSC